MKIIKNILLCFLASFAFGVLWLVFLNLADVASVSSYEVIVCTGFVVASIGIALLFTRRYFKQAGKNMLKKVGYVAVVAIPAFAVMVGAFYLAIFFALTYLH